MSKKGKKITIIKMDFVSDFMDQKLNIFYTNFIVLEKTLLQCQYVQSYITV